MPSSFNDKHPFLFKRILLATIIAGTLDILAAILVYDIIMQRVTAMQILNGIAMTVFGKISGNEIIMALVGLLIHYIITFCFAAAYFLLFPYISFLKKNILISGLLYGILVWFIMNVIIVPAATGHRAPFLLPAFLRQIITLIVCIGLPIAFISAKYYEQKQIKS